MDKKILVEKDIEHGKKLLEALDDAQIEITAAFWFFRSDSDNWRLHLASPVVDESGPLETYDKILKILKKSKNINIALDDITVISPHQEIIKLFCSTIKTKPNAVANIRFTNNAIQNVIIDDALIYRMTRQPKSKATQHSEDV